MHLCDAAIPFWSCCPFTPGLQFEAVPDAAVELGDAVQHAEGGLVLLAIYGR